MDRLDTGAKIDDVILFSRRHPRGTAEFMHAALRGVVAGVNAYRHEVSGGTVPFNRIFEKNEVQVRGVTVTQNNTTMDAAFLALLYDNTYWP